MPRNVETTAPYNNLLETIFIADTGLSGQSVKFKFIDGSVNYLGTAIKQEFNYLLIDNIGKGSIRFSINYPDINMSVPVYGAKTLLPGDSIYFQGNIWNITIYYMEDSSVELVLKRD
jgi:hypothetical protein